ncbi:hypothetical protein A3L04_08800 [Thermococcus chitonophagus]|uniref:Uncharacterized protein n=1 Tax=Thermococcus chitonophagus TaxID=54262 RepID=A0A2Z2N9Y6_9EURY|nr:hypothetical protein [Thermococcus chitonophagus]ASJ17160.1 hypothetical protein A3L04_08800 [Thermococcus chitonophagus]
MVAIKSFGEAVSFLISNPKVILIPLVFLLILAPINTYIQKDNVLKSLENLEKGSIIFEEHGAAEELTPEQLRALLVIALLYMLLLSAAQYSVTMYAYRRRLGETLSLGDALISGLENVIPAFIVTLISAIILGLIAIVVAIPFSVIIGIGAIGGSKGMITVGMLALLVGEFFALTFSGGAVSVIFPAYVVNNSIRRGIEGLMLPLRRPKSTLSFGLLLMLTIFTLYIVASMLVFLPLIFSRSLAGLLIGALLQAPIMALLHAFTSVASLSFYENLREELLNQTQGIMTDVRTY